MRPVLRNAVLLLAVACAVPGFADDDEQKTCTHHWTWRSDSAFAWQVQVDEPVKDLGRELDNRTGLGLGMQWTRDRANGVTNRTRLEWNVFPQGNAVGTAGLQTQASNYLLSFDRLYHFSGEAKGFYVLGGLGAVRWFMEQSAGGAATADFHTTKLAVTGGAGYRFNRAVAVEARYLVSTVDRTFDGNVLQGAFSMRF